MLEFMGDGRRRAEESDVIVVVTSALCVDPVYVRLFDCFPLHCSDWKEQLDFE